MKTKITREEALRILKYARAKKLEVPEEARKVLTRNVIKIHNLGLIDKDEFDSYLYLTKAAVRQK